MDVVDGLRTFIAVVETGSFTAAGRRIGISNKLASKYVAALEMRLGRSLLHRTTRSISLSEDGERWLPYARDALAALERADAALVDPADALVGQMRITTGTTFGELYLAAAVRSFVDAHPGLRVDLVLADAPGDLVAGGFDLAVRIGVPKDSSYRMLRVGSTLPRVAASPAFLAEHGRPLHPRDLEGRRAILDLNDERPGVWTFDDGRSEIAVRLEGNLAINSASATIRQAIEGHGFVRAPDILLKPFLESGELRTVLDDFGARERSIHCLSNRTAFRSAKITAFTAFLKDELRRHR